MSGAASAQDEQTLALLAQDLDNPLFEQMSKANAG